MNANFDFHQGADAQTLAEHLAGELSVLITQAIDQKGSAVLALSGGSTPKPLFEALAEHDIDWAKVIITLVDERWVDESHELSNAAFMKTYLLSKLPDTVRFVPLYQAAESVDASLPLVLNNYLEATGSSVDSNEALLTCHSPSTQVERVTWSLPVLLNTSFLALHFTGEGKKDVFEAACDNASSEAVSELPIRSAIFQDRIALNVYYAD